jgi:O-antigen/teichoic acid export membrane protein
LRFGEKTRLRKWPGARGHVGALSWTGLDHAFSSLSNVVVSLALARGEGARGLGTFTVAFGVYLVVLGFQRTLISDPLVASLPGPRDRDSERGALGAAIAFSTMASLAVLGVGAALRRSEFLALAAVLPFVCSQDLLRYVAFRRLESRTAAVLDALWTCASVGAWWWIREGSPTHAVLLWGAGGALGMFAGLFLLGVSPVGVRSAWRWWNSDARMFGLALAVESVAYTVTTQGSVFIVAGALGSADLGSLRAAQILLAPSAMVLAAFSAFALPRLARRLTELTRSDAQLASLASLALVAPLAVGALVAADPVTRLLYGSAVAVPRQLLLPLALGSLVSAGAAGPYLSLKARRRGKSLVSTRAVTGALGCGFVAAALGGGVIAVAWALAAQAVAYFIAVWSLEVRASPLGKVAAAAPNSPTLAGGKM